MKKITILSIVIALVLACAFGISVNAADNASFKAGDTVVVEFDLKGTMQNGDYKVTYNDDVLTFKSITPCADGAAYTKNAGEVVASFFTPAQKVVVTFTAKADSTVEAANVTLVPKLFTNTEGEDVNVQAGSPVVTVTPAAIEENVVENEVINEVPANEVENEVSNEVANEVSNEVSTPATSNTVNNDDDKTTYDQTGANIAIVAVVALAVVLGSAIVIKRK